MAPLSHKIYSSDNLIRGENMPVKESVRRNPALDVKNTLTATQNENS